MTGKIKPMGFSRLRITNIGKMMQTVFDKDDIAITILWNGDSSSSTFAYGIMITE